MKYTNTIVPTSDCYLVFSKIKFKEEFHHENFLKTIVRSGPCLALSGSSCRPAGWGFICCSFCLGGSGRHRICAFIYITYKCL